MKFIDVIGLFGAFLSGITFFPQVYRTWKLRSAKELSLTMILIILLSNVVWLIYAFSKQDVAVTVKFKKKLHRAVTLEDIKKRKELRDLALIKQSRLSVMPIDYKSWKIINNMSRI